MPLLLSRVVIDTSGPAPVVTERATGLADADLAAIVAVHGASPAGAAGLAGRAWPIERCVPLATDAGERRWAVGREHGGRAVWRVVGPADPDRLGGHPAWLWTADAWFDPELPADAQVRAPAALPLRHLVRLMAPVGGRNRRTIKALAAVVSAVRAGRPTAVAVDAELLASASHPARWFALALLCALPPALRDRLRISVGAPLPAPGPGDVSLEAPGAAEAIDAADPPDEGEDLVAYYVRNRLYDDDPEALEAAAYLFDTPAGTDDRWGDGIAALIRDGLPGVSEITDGLVEQDPERAVRALTARLRAGAPLDEALTAQIAEITMRTRDPRPWRALARRPPLQRADAVDALLPTAHKLKPGPELVAELAALYPRGAPLDLWVPALLGWLEAGCAPDAVVRAIERTLLEWPLAATGPTRASVWTEVVRILVGIGRDEQAMIALTSAVAREIARDGGGRALVSSYTLVPRRFREPAHLEALVSMLHGVPDGDRAAADLFRLVKADPEEARALVRAWVRRALAAPDADDPLFEAVRDTPFLRTWAEALLDEVGEAPFRWATARAGPLWDAVADAVIARATDPRQALIALGSLPTTAPPAQGAVALAEAAVRASEFPDPELAAAAEALAHAPGASLLWSWLTVTAASPDVWEDETVDATVVELCGAALDEPALRVAAVAAERLGAASGWEPIDHARWVVRLALAPGAFTSRLLRGLLAGIAGRSDATPFFAAVLDPLLDLPPEHAAPRRLCAELAASGWRGAPLRRVLDAVGPERLPEPLLPAFLALAEGRPTSLDDA